MLARAWASVRGCFTRQPAQEVINGDQQAVQQEELESTPSLQEESPLDLNRCAIEWDKPGDQQVGDFSVMTIKVLRSVQLSFSSSSLF